MRVTTDSTAVEEEMHSLDRLPRGIQNLPRRQAEFTHSRNKGRQILRWERAQKVIAKNHVRIAASKT